MGKDDRIEGGNNTGEIANGVELTITLLVFLIGI